MFKLKGKRLTKAQMGEICFLLGLFVFYFMWACVQSYNGAPDEKMRYQVAQYIYEYWKLPRGDDPLLRNANWGFSYAFNPILSYMIGAVFMKLVSFVTTSSMALVVAARMVSVLCGVGTAFMTLRIGKRLFSDKAAWIFTAIVSLMPGAVFIYSYVNTDSLAMFAAAIIVYAWICGIQDGWSVRNSVILGVGVAICALSYYNAYGFILCSILLFGITLFMQSKEQKDYKLFLKRGFLVCGIALALAGWWFVRNYILYDGDFLGQATSSACGELYGAAGFKPSEKVSPQSQGLSLWQMLSQSYSIGETPISILSWAEVTSRSFIGRFGYLDICLPTWFEFNYIDFLKMGCLLVFLHPVATFFIRKNKQWDKRAMFNCAMLIAAIIPLVISIYYSYTSDYQPQGRYCLPMLIPLAYFVATGYQNVVQAAIASKWRNKVYALVCVLVVLAAIYSFTEVLLPAWSAVPFGEPTPLTGV